MPTVRRAVTLPWVPEGLRLELEVAARHEPDGSLAPRQTRGGGVRARRGWLVAARAVRLAEADFGPDESWVLGQASRRWPALDARFTDGAAEAERLARAGVVELDCRLDPALNREGYAGWRLVGEAAENHGRQVAARRGLRSELQRELRESDLLERLEAGPPHGMAWTDFVAVLRAAERWRDVHAHGRQVWERELAGRVAHTKWWTTARRALLSDLLGQPWGQLFPPKPRQLRVHGPIDHPEAGVWAHRVEEVPLARGKALHSILLVENSETYSALMPFSDQGFFMLEVAGGPLPAEVRLVERIHGIAPDVPVFAAFDPDPAGIRIARVLERRTGVPLRSDLMTPETLSEARPLELVPWDHDVLDALEGEAGVFEPLRVAIATARAKAEQETVHPWLANRLAVLGRAGRDRLAT
jgi:hypothetical protein